jgi:hypothetical protein
MSDRKGKAFGLLRIGAAAVTLAVVAPLATARAEAHPGFGPHNRICSAYQVPTREPVAERQ